MTWFVAVPRSICFVRAKSIAAWFTCVASDTFFVAVNASDKLAVLSATENPRLTLASAEAFNFAVVSETGPPARPSAFFKRSSCAWNLLRFAWPARCQLRLFDARLPIYSSSQCWFRGLL
jgi:hypothetical protein